jgi:acetylornithine deacetylase
MNAPIKTTPQISPSQEVLDMIERLVAIPTVSRDSNLGLIETARDYLAGLGVKSRLTYDASKKKANLFATLGEGRKPGIILSGHTDVVPVEGQVWSTDPFTPVTRDGRLYGRGSADMKGFIGTALAMAPKFLAADMDSAMHLALSFDEEVGCIGVRGLIRDLEDIGLKPAGCIVGEPTDMQPVIAHKGMHRFRCCVKGREAHSSYTNRGVNAIEYAAQIVVFIRQLADRMAELEQRDYGFTVRTLPGTDAASLYAEIRAFAETLLPSMRKVEPNAAIEFDWVNTSPGLVIEESADIVKLAVALSGNKGGGKVSYGTEAGLFQKAGIPTVICGPGSIEQAHSPDEFVGLEQLAQCEAFLMRLIETPTPVHGK